MGFRVKVKRAILYLQMGWGMGGGNLNVSWYGGCRQTLYVFAKSNVTVR